MGQIAGASVLVTFGAGWKELAKVPPGTFQTFARSSISVERSRPAERGCLLGDELRPATLP